MDLAGLGLNGYESSAYLALLSRSGLTAVELATRAKIPRQRIYDVVQSLTTLGLCTSTDANPKLLFATDPAIALATLSQVRAAELEREKERLQSVAQLLTTQLGPLYSAGKSANDPLQYVEVLGDPARIATRALALANASTRHVNSLIKRPMILSTEENWRFLLAPLEQGVRYRALYEKSALEDEELLGWMKELSGRGQEIRLAESLPVKLQAFDDEVALVSMQDPVGGPPSFTALAIRHRGTVALLNLAFEALWTEGEKF